jgi:RNA polymerase sigma factor (sigma-70 family)
MAGPPRADDREDQGDNTLVSQAQQGNQLALEELIRCHQAWIFSLAQRMVGGPGEAEDAAQEILIKMITKLSTFRRESSFRTWLYRIGVNHILNRRRGRWERRFASFERHQAFADTMRGDMEAAATQQSPEDALLAEETKSLCLAGMLLCLDRTQRLAFILGAVMGLDSRVGGELLEVSADNFRQVLSRARRQLASFMDGRCGLINDANACRCAAKTRACIAAGLVDPQHLRFTPEHLSHVREVVAAQAHLADEALECRVEATFRDRPALPSPDMVAIVRKALKQPDLQQLMRFH